MYVVSRMSEDTQRIFFDSETNIIKTPEDDDASYVFQNIETGEIFYFDDNTHINIYDCINIDPDWESSVGYDGNLPDDEFDEKGFGGYDFFWTAFSCISSYGDPIVINFDGLYIYCSHDELYAWYEGFAIYEDRGRLCLQDMLHVRDKKLYYIDSFGKPKELDMSLFKLKQMSLGSFMREIVLN